MPDLDDYKKFERRLFSYADLGSEDYLGLERLRTALEITDTVVGTISRFFSSSAKLFSKFTRSELDEFTGAHPLALRKIMVSPLVNVNTSMVPIPSGMAGTYQTTIKTILDMLKHYPVDPNKEALTELLKKIKTKKFIEIPELITETLEIGETREKDKAIAAKLFSNGKLTHTTGRSAFGSQSGLKEVHALLGHLTRDYKEMIEVSKFIKSFESGFESEFRKVFEKDQDPLFRSDVMRILKEAGANLAFRAYLIDQLQKVEHNYVMCLTQLLKQIRSHPQTA